MTNNGHGHKIDFGARRKTIEVEVPELGGTVILRELSVRQFLQLQASYTPTRGLDSLIEQVAESLIDADGNKLYSVADVEEMSRPVFEILSAAVLKLNGLDQQTTADTKKKFETTPVTASASDSPVI